MCFVLTGVLSFQEQWYVWEVTVLPILFLAEGAKHRAVGLQLLDEVLSFGRV